jgi:hypothetical protein
MVCPGTGCAIDDARSLERRIIPRGIWCFHEPITSPKVWVAVPWWRRNAVAASPYGPAPTTATSVDPAMIPLSVGAAEPRRMSSMMTSPVPAPLAGVTPHRRGAVTTGTRRARRTRVR